MSGQRDGRTGAGTRDVSERCCLSACVCVCVCVCVRACVQVKLPLRPTPPWANGTRLLVSFSLSRRGAAACRRLSCGDVAWAHEASRVQGARLCPSPDQFSHTRRQREKGAVPSFFEEAQEAINPAQLSSAPVLPSLESKRKKRKLNVAWRGVGRRACREIGGPNASGPMTEVPALPLPAFHARHKLHALYMHKGYRNEPSVRKKCLEEREI
ncbi:hypothetical protein BCV69DRAFT_203519 [Microstroma glucosiphilum]|uniref:Uncharacterized protein n=1 Tax=Pseudomicrostroma glucosiphilum TaxID=1684307 RepID=A0A316U4W5_9BASI|nr:hypothetical protein BCV69DRAFT_203519 [Pseudomicrostroma glucosiphilum]PWN20230.1 hypothetical protein BCV69DRAFT_203519 [Pseudomicrostroma glucosiphilum]